jgi:hypothetical protein
MQVTVTADARPTVRNVTRRQAGSLTSWRKFSTFQTRTTSLVKSSTDQNA